MNAIEPRISLQSNRSPIAVHQPAACVRSQAAFVRSLLDELERAMLLDAQDDVTAQLVEELARLGSRCIDVANTLAKLIDADAELSPSHDA